MQIGSKAIPFFRLSSTLFNDIKTIYEKFGNNDVEQGVVSEVLGHKSPASGTFKNKIASMRDYGLIDGRGKIRVTEIGEKIAFHQNDEEYNDALIRGVNRIPLWHELYEKFTVKGLDLPDADFWLEIRDSCGLTIEQAKSLAPDVRSAYREDIKFVRAPRSSTPPMTPNTGVNTQPNVPSTPSAIVPEGMTTVAYGDWKVILPKDGMGEAWDTLKAMVDAVISTKKKKPSS